MPLSHSVFRTLPLEEQIPLVWMEGTFVARRWEEEDSVSLYHMAGDFLCEVYLEHEFYVVMRTRTFATSACLANYACYVQLDDLTNH